MSSRFSSNSEAFASELLENLEVMCLRYYMAAFSLHPHTGVLPVAKGIIVFETGGCCDNIHRLSAYDLQTTISNKELSNPKLASEFLGNVEKYYFDNTFTVINETAS